MKEKEGIIREWREGMPTAILAIEEIVFLTRHFAAVENRSTSNFPEDPGQILYFPGDLWVFREVKNLLLPGIG